MKTIIRSADKPAGGRTRTPTPWDDDYEYPDPEEVVAPIVEEFKKNLDKYFPPANKPKSKGK